MESRDGGIKPDVAVRHLAPEALEWLATLAAIAFLFWQSTPFRDAAFIRGAGDRYQQALELTVPILPRASGTQRVVDLCTRLGGWLPDVERTGAAGRTGACSADSRHPIGATAAQTTAPAEFENLAKAYEALAKSLAQPVKARLSRLAELENRAREGRAETDVQGAIEGLAGETLLYRTAYGIEGASARSAPLDCAWRHLEAQYRAASRNASESGRVLALLGPAALLDGDPVRTVAAAFPAGETARDTW